jgi:uncharacterized membrane protein
MSDALYEFLARLGYSHPIHPVFVHMPIGLTIGAFCLYLAGVTLRSREMVTSSYHAVVFALLFLMLTIPTGIMDWQRFYGGAWLLEIKMKLALAGALFLLLVFVTMIGRRLLATRPRFLPILYFLGFLNVAGLGFFGGQLVFHGRVPTVPNHLHAGQTLFNGHCSGCHERGGNVFMPNLALRSAPQLQAYGDFVKFVRNPRLPNGQQGPMPWFGQEKLTDEELKELYNYVRFAFIKPERDEMIRKAEAR